MAFVPLERSTPRRASALAGKNIVASALRRAPIILHCSLDHQMSRSFRYKQQALPLIEGSLETKVPTIWTDEKQHSQEEAEPGRNSDV